MEEFEKRYDGLAVEKEMQRFWEDNNIYKFVPDVSRPLYSIDTPPPTVSGSLHIGHIFSYTQAEMIARFRRMQGYNVFYPFGFDDNGLPSERLVEKETGIKAHDIPRSQFQKSCIEITKKYEDEFMIFLGFNSDKTTYFKWDLNTRFCFVKNLQRFIFPYFDPIYDQDKLLNKIETLKLLT